MFLCVKNFLKKDVKKMAEQEVKYYVENLEFAVTSMYLLYKEEDIDDRNVCKKAAQEAIDYFSDHHDEIKEFFSDDLAERLQYLTMLAKRQMEKC